MTDTKNRFDVVIVGAGFAGLYMLHKIRSLGLSVVLFEAGSGIGGTWYWNRYPGARCDVDSLEYSYSFSEELQQEWSWSERFAAQPEILCYLDHVADRFDLRRDIRLDTRVTAAVLGDNGHWTIGIGDGGTVQAQFTIMATGCLSTARAPEFPGIETFKGEIYHTGQWPHGPVDLSGKRVGLIGTGSSGIQVAPMIASAAEQLTVFQRTPNFIIPARNTPTDRAREQEWKAQYRSKREQARETTAGILYDYNDIKALSVSDEQRNAAYEARWNTGGVNFVRSFADLMLDTQANATAATFVHGKIRETVRNPDVARVLTPTDHPLGSKRICIDSGFWAIFNEPHVQLVDLRQTPILEATPAGLRTETGEHALDCLVFATGFDAVTGTLNRIDIRGTDGLALREVWAEGPRSYLGLMTVGFPNLFTITGPGSPSILTNVVVSIEQHVEWIAGALVHLRAHDFNLIEAEAQAQDDWMLHVSEVAERTLFVLANSWYMGANIPGKPRVFLPYAGGFAAYRRRCEEIVADGYSGFRLASRETTQHQAA